LERYGKETKIVWDECGTAHSVRGMILKDDPEFIELILIDGTMIRISRSRIIKVETSGGGR